MRSTRERPQRRPQDFKHCSTRRSDTPMRELVERVWFGEDLLARAARAALLPGEMLYGAAIGLREALYDLGVLTTHKPALPTVSVGNLTVGGTGKTPVAAWIATELV